MHVFALLATLFLPSLQSVPRAGAGEILVAVAANFSAPAAALATRFGDQTGHRVTISTGSSGTLYAQIVNGAPFHILLSADTVRPVALERAGHAVPNTRFTYAVGRLALWSRRPGFAARGPAALAGHDYRHLAIAMPSTAPYGAAAVQTLEALGLADRLAEKLVRGESVAQTFQFVATGNAELGFVALAQVIDRPSADYWIVPDTLHEPIAQQAVLLTRGRTNPDARRFLEFLRSSDAGAIITRFGYARP